MDDSLDERLESTGSVGDETESSNGEYEERPSTSDISFKGHIGLIDIDDEERGAGNSGPDKPIIDPTVPYAFVTLRWENNRKLKKVARHLAQYGETELIMKRWIAESGERFNPRIRLRCYSPEKQKELFYDFLQNNYFNPKHPLSYVENITKTI